MIKKVIKNIPNTITILNLVLGCIGIIEITNEKIYTAEICFWMGLLFDFLDGFSARILHSKSNIGIQLDSLADMVTSGVLPGLFIFRALSTLLPFQLLYLKYLALVIPAFTALRLARFNVEKNDESGFKGLPSPAGACFIIYISIFVLSTDDVQLSFLKIFKNHWFLLISILATSLMLVSNLKFFSLKFNPKSLLNQHFYAKLAFLIFILSIIIGLIFFLKREAFLIIILGYILISIFFNLKNNKSNTIF